MALALRSSSGLRAMKMKPPLVSPWPPVKATTLSTPGSLLITADQLLDGVVHHRERGVLRSLHAAEDHSRVLLREKALGNYHRPRPR